MTSHPPRYLAAIDDKPEHVIAVATELATRLGDGVELHLVHVVKPWTEGLPPAMVSYDGILEEGRLTLDRALEMAGHRFHGSIFGHLLGGETAHEIVALAGKIGAELIVVGTSDKNLLERLTLGTVSQKIAREAKCSVLVARAKATVATVAIEPPCPACVDVQKRSNRQELWCERHRTRHPHGHIHSELPQSFALGSMLLRPE